MNVDTELQAIAQQQNVPVTGDGDPLRLRSTRAGQLFTADWKTSLVLAGHAHNLTVGGISAGADVAPITGGGNGTTINSDRPEMAVGTPAGYYHIPLGFSCAVQNDIGAADADEVNIILFADLEKTIPLPIAAGSTHETTQNLLDGGPAAVSEAASAYHTSDIADPVCTMILGYSTAQAAQVSGAGTIVCVLKLDFDPSYPRLLKGPCSVVACWGGNQAATGIATYNWAEVPTAYFE